MPAASRKQQTPIAIVGPTAGGKSNVAMELAVSLGGEIICCDSVQIYRGFHIGCAKPSAADRQRVPHHLIDVAAWDEPFDAARWVELADVAVAAIHARGGVPIICGGTGLYLRAFRYGLIDVPPADPALRAELEAREREQPGCLFGRLQQIDPDGAAAIEPNNIVQIVRALEIAALCGEPASAVRGRHGFGTPRVDLDVFWLCRDRDDLRARIAARAIAMVDAGLLAEVEGLLASGVAPDCRPMRAVGYREACAVLGGKDGTELAERIATSTWHYAKRQQTWLRKERDVVAVDLTRLDRETGGAAAAIMRARDR